MGFLSSLKDGKIMSMDPSTNGLAFSIFTWDKLHASGKILLKPKEWQDKFKVINATLPVLLDKHEPTHFLIEQSIYIQNPNTSRKLAYINGCVLGTVLSCGIKNVSDVPPLTWKPYLGYKMVSAKEKKEWAITMLPKEVKKKAEFERKERIKRIIDVKIPGHGSDDYDIIDSMGIGLWGLSHIL